MIVNNVSHSKEGLKENLAESYVQAFLVRRGETFYYIKVSAAGIRTINKKAWKGVGWCKSKRFYISLLTLEETKWQKKVKVIAYK